MPQTGLLTFAFLFGHLFALVLTVASLKREGSLPDHILTENEYKVSMGEGYVFFEVLEPEELRYTFKVHPSHFSPIFNNTFTNIKLVPSIPTCGCGSFENSEAIEGQVALVERGECSFVSKAIKAMEAGAAAIIITDDDVGNDDLYIHMQDDTTEREVRIPAGFLLGKDGHIIRRTLHKLELNEAIINIPVNISSIPIHKLKQPPWLVW